MAKTKPTKPTGGEKRKNDGAAPVPKRAKKKEEEKENRSQPQPVNSSANSSTAGSSSSTARSSSTGESSSTTASSRDSPVTKPSNRRVQSAPVKLADLKKQLVVASDAGEFGPFLEGTPEEWRKRQRFLVRNVVQRKLAEERVVRIEKRPKQTMKPALETMVEKMYENSDLHELCTVTIDKTDNLGNEMDIENATCDTADVHTYTIIVDHKDNIKVIDHWLSRAALIGTTTMGVKKISVTSQEMSSAKLIYFAATVARVTAKEWTKRSRRSAKQDMYAISNLVQEVRIGCTLLYSAEENLAYRGGKHQFLLFNVEDASVKTRLADVPDGRWLEDADFLNFLLELNDSKDPNPASLLFNTSVEDIETVVRDIATRPLRTTRVVRVPQQPTTDKKILYLAARLPCLAFTGTTPEERRMFFRKEYFAGGGRVTHIEDSDYYRKTFNRSLAIEGNADVHGHPDPNRVVEPKRTSRFGPGAAVHKGHTPFRKDIHRLRQGDWVPLLNPDALPIQQNSLESFTLNNPAVMTAIEMRLRKKQKVPTGRVIEGSEMTVVKVPISEKKKLIHNTKLEMAGKKLEELKKKLEKAKTKAEKAKIEKGITRGPPRAVKPVAGDVDTDIDGREIHGFKEFFFPQGKSEIYDIVLRNYVSEVGCRPGTISADWMSRIMTGFIASRYEYIFEQKLENIFEKHLQMMGMHTAGWKMMHFMVPRKKMMDMKRMWTLRKVGNGAADPIQLEEDPADPIQLEEDLEIELEDDQTELE